MEAAVERIFMPKTEKASSPTVRKSSTPGANPTTEEIALRAYHIYLERDGAPGNPLDDWTCAERELRQRVSKPRRKPGLKLVAA
jgi:hypothetical protein